MDSGFNSLSREPPPTVQYMQDLLNHEAVFEDERSSLTYSPYATTELNNCPTMIPTITAVPGINMPYSVNGEYSEPYVGGQSQLPHGVSSQDSESARTSLANEPSVSSTIYGNSARASQEFGSPYAISEDFHQPSARKDCYETISAANSSSGDSTVHNPSTTFTSQGFCGPQHPPATRAVNNSYEHSATSFVTLGQNRSQFAPVAHQKAFSRSVGHPAPPDKAGTPMVSRPGPVPAAKGKGKGKSRADGLPVHPNFVFMPIPGIGAGGKKRPRRRPDEIERAYKCGWNGCEKAYGFLNHLNAHVRMQGHGEKRVPAEFREIRKEQRAKKKEQANNKSLEEEARRRAEAVAHAVSTTALDVQPLVTNSSSIRDEMYLQHGQLRPETTQPTIFEPADGAYPMRSSGPHDAMGNIPQYTNADHAPAPRFRGHVPQIGTSQRPPPIQRNMYTGTNDLREEFAPQNFNTGYATPAHYSGQGRQVSIDQNRAASTFPNRRIGTNGTGFHSIQQYAYGGYASALHHYGQQQSMLSDQLWPSNSEENCGTDANFGAPTNSL